MDKIADLASQSPEKVVSDDAWRQGQAPLSVNDSQTGHWTKD